MGGSVLDVMWFSVAYPVSLLLAVALGYGVAEVRYRRRGLVWKSSGIESAVITIFGLLLSFTLLSANNAHKERTALIHQNAEAVTDLYRESQLLPPASQAAVRSLLRQFLALELAAHRPGQPADSAHSRQLEALYQAAWQHFRDSLRTTSPQAVALRQLLPGFNKLNASTSRLHYALAERTPAPIMLLLLVSSWAIGVLVGFTNSAQEARHYFVPVLFVIISVLTIQAIRDLDNPGMGFIRPSYQNLKDLQQLLAEDQ